jgi:glycosyltransferase 2 family protein
VKLDWRVALGFVLSGVLLWLALRNVELGDVMRSLRNANVPLFLLSAAVSTCIFPLRAVRWKSILAPVAGAVPFGPLWRSTAIGMMINNVIPARAGEVARAFALTREVPRVPFTTSLASLAVDRIFDAIVLLALMFGAMLSPSFPSGARLAGMTVQQFASAGITGVIGLLVVCWLAVLMPTRVITIVRAVARRLLPRFEGRLVAIAEQGLGGLAVLRDGTRFLLVLWWALVHWLVHALALWIGFAAVDIELPFSTALFLQGVLGFAVALPSSPGFVGVFELAAVRGLGVYGVSESQALTWAFGYHALSFIPITLFGVFYLLRLGITLGDIRGAADRSSDVRDAAEAFAAPTRTDPPA